MISLGALSNSQVLLFHYDFSDTDTHNLNQNPQTISDLSYNNNDGVVNNSNSIFYDSVENAFRFQGNSELELLTSTIFPVILIN